MLKIKNNGESLVYRSRTGAQITVCFGTFNYIDVPGLREWVEVKPAMSIVANIPEAETEDVTVADNAGLASEVETEEVVVAEKKQRRNKVEQ